MSAVSVIVSTTIADLKQLARQHGNYLRMDLCDGKTGERIAIVVAVGTEAEEFLQRERGRGLDVNPVDFAEGTSP